MSAPTTPPRQNSSGGSYLPYPSQGGYAVPPGQYYPPPGRYLYYPSYLPPFGQYPPPPGQYPPPTGQYPSSAHDALPLCSRCSVQISSSLHSYLLQSVAETEVTAPSQTAQVDYAIEASRLVVETLQNIGSMVGIPYLNEAASVALRILTIVQDIKSRRQEFTDLANDACGLVYTVVIECQKMMQDGQQVPEGIQVHIVALARNLTEIEKFSKRKLKRGFLQKLIHHTKDVDEVTRYRVLLRQSLDKFGIQSSISIQRNLQLVLKNLEKQRDDLNSARERRRTATRLEIIRIQEQDREAKRLEAARRAECDTGKKRKRVKRAERQRKEEEDSSKRLKTDNGHHPPQNDNLYPALDRQTPNPRPHSYDDLFPRPVYSPPSFSYPHQGYPIYAPSPYYLTPPLSSPGGMYVSGSSVLPGGAPISTWNLGNISRTTTEDVPGSTEAISPGSSSP
ncbi:hypothetical protein GALMADRAFT_139394 [Galerina marginata CBS 339.88]|uniref:Uncharacterized protein n=1 Tax=Galerina marginata (strain CBS 339.88) TaxID=685588 RepID=A0A067SZX8_GALM3|nr:hypothetical protein GALMADRAFT_139394 [Galerina marginata CBS 339.88]